MSTTTSASQSKGTKPKRASRRRRQRSAVHGTLTHTQARQARRQAIEARRRQFAIAGRHPHTTRDTNLSGPPPIRTRLVREAAQVVDADPDLVDWVTEKVTARHRRGGRPRELSVRTALICFIIQVRIHRHFLLSHLPELLSTMSWRTRRNLGIDYLRNGQPTQVTYAQLLDVFHAIADTFDAWDEALDTLPDDDAAPIRRQRAADLQEFVDRLVTASTAGAPLWKGDAALDATLKWSHERPSSSTLNSKIERRGADGDAGPAVPLSDVLGADGDDATIDPNRFSSVDPVDVANNAQTNRNGRSWPRTWGRGSTWVGRANKTKAVHGIALHSVVRANADEPCLVEAFTVTPADGDPADAVRPVLRRIYDQRVNDPAVLAAAEAGEALILGDVIADPAYSVSSERWFLPIKALGATPIARLHRTNQEGLRFHKVGRGRRSGEVATIGGRPVCECAALHPVAELRFPKFPYTTRKLADYHRQLAALDQFEWTPNGATRPNGTRQWLSPHGATTGPDGNAGGCEYCTTTSGPVVADDGIPIPRCCTVRSRLLPADVTAFDAGVRHGGPAWYARWNPRNRVEGSYGILKSLTVVNYGRNFHRFVGLARETLAATFAIIAYNAHLLAQWEARQALAGPPEDDGYDPFNGLPSDQPTETIPDATVTRARSRRSKRTGPKGLEFLGQSRAGPGDTT